MVWWDQGSEKVGFFCCLFVFEGPRSKLFVNRVRFTEGALL